MAEDDAVSRQDSALRNMEYGRVKVRDHALLLLGRVSAMLLAKRATSLATSTSNAPDSDVRL